MTQTLAVLQARTSSSRLPGKVLKPILGKPMLSRQIERLQRCRQIDLLVVATSIEPSDDNVAEVCKALGVACFRGSLHDVLDRFIQTAQPYSPESVVRLTGDCPLADPILIDEVIRLFHHSAYDYLSNVMPSTYPDGLDVEVMRYRCLKEAAVEAKLPLHREHVTLFLRTNPDRYRLANYASSVDRSQLRWTVDEPEDLEFVCEVYARLYEKKPDFTTRDVLDLLERQPALQAINAKFKRNQAPNEFRMDVVYQKVIQFQS